MRGHVRKRRKWEFIVDVGPHPVTGKRRQKSKSGFASKREAESEVMQGEHSPRDRARYRGLEVAKLRPGHIRAVLNRMQRRDFLLRRSLKRAACSVPLCAKPSTMASPRSTPSRP